MKEQDSEKSAGPPDRERARPPEPAASSADTRTRTQRTLGAAIDASALLALLFAESGAEAVADAIADGAAISSVNLSEVATVLVRHEQDPESILLPVREQVAVEPFTAEDALSAAALSSLTTPSGLSLGDRACLALAKRLNAAAVTADRAWTTLDLGIEVQLIRPRAKPDP